MLREQTAADPARRHRALAGLTAFQRAPRVPRHAADMVVATAGRARLIDRGGAGPAVVLVPSLINPPHILDLAPGNSLCAALAAAGLRPLLVDWGTPDAGDADLTIAGHVERLLLPLIAAAAAANGGRPPLLAGYCLGGTMAIAAAALAPVAGLALIAAPWRFAGFPDEARDAIATIGEAAQPIADTLGLFPIETLQAAFWRLDPARTIAKFERFAGLDPTSDAGRAFVTLEDWASDGPPLTRGAGMELVDAFFASDAPGTAMWRVGGRTIDPAALPCPVLDIVSTTDRIVPAASAAGVGDRITLGLGHVGMVVGGRAPGALWEPLQRWLCALAPSW
ncbi:MAG: alpha/beta fold hydrolase [Sphingomonas fennica]